MLRRPKWILFTIIAFGAAVAMLLLARWQWQRHGERADFNDAVRRRAAAPVEPLLDVLADADPEEAEWRRVTVQGTFVDTPRFEVVNRSQFGRPGRNDVAALRLEDGSLLIVNRGFVVSDEPIPTTPTGRVELVGQIRTSEQRRTGQPADNPSAQLSSIRRIDLDILASQFDEPLLDVYLQVLDADPPQPSALQPITPPSLDGGPHLSYTVQWSVFSMCVVLGWVLAVRRESRIQRAMPSAG
jgi:cytochrome oxidase assembly protein ShyY1